MASKLHRYEGESVRVTYDARRCIHVGECVRGLPAVFDPKETPWVDVSGADAEAVVDVVARCPTGALQTTRLDGGEGETPPDENTVVVAADGPLYAHGRLTVRNPDGDVVVEDTRVALCRCGASEHKPFCDGAHSAAGFKAESKILDPQIRDTGHTGDGLEITVTRGGPLILSGPVTVRAESEGDRCSGTKTALCRCGASDNKPFCDGAHARVGFSG